MMDVELLTIDIGSPPLVDLGGLHGKRYVFDGKGGPRLLLTGSLHGDEPTSMAALWHLSEELPKASLTGIVTIIPCVNLLAACASSRLIPHEGTDLNRVFPGRTDGSLAERLAAALVRLLNDYDALIDVHSAGWSIPFVLVDQMFDAQLDARIVRWATASSMPVIREAPSENDMLAAGARSWSAWAISQGKPALTFELSGLHMIDSAVSKGGAGALLNLLTAAPDLSRDGDIPAPLPSELKFFSNTGGFFESFYRPGDRVSAGETIGVVRDFYGDEKEAICAKKEGLVIDLQPISSVHAGSWVATLAVLT